MLENELSVPVVLENDVNAAAFGEHRYGAGRGAKQLICVFVGTGVGGGVIVDGKLLRGTTGNSAEVGHTIFRPGGRTCSCGRSGCVEAYAGGASIPEHYVELGGRKGFNAARIWGLAQRGDKLAAQVAADTVDALVTLIVNLQTLFDTEKMVLGGGVLVHLSGLYHEVLERLKRYLIRNWKSKVRIVRSKLGATAGILGAAALARELT
jgi:glucokinase